MYRLAWINDWNWEWIGIKRNEPESFLFLESLARRVMLTPLVSIIIILIVGLRMKGSVMKPQMFSQYRGRYEIQENFFWCGLCHSLAAVWLLEIIFIKYVVFIEAVFHWSSVLSEVFPRVIQVLVFQHLVLSTGPVLRGMFQAFVYHLFSAKKANKSEKGLKPAHTEVMVQVWFINLSLHLVHVVHDHNEFRSRSDIYLSILDTQDDTMRFLLPRKRLLKELLLQRDVLTCHSVIIRKRRCHR